MIELKGVRKRFGEQVVLDGVDFVVREGETMALLGPSGTGKSVLLKHINGLIRPDAGKVLVDDRLVTGLKRHELAELRTQIGYVFQNGALFDSLNVFENVRLGLSDESKFSDMEYAQSRVAECAFRRAHVSKPSISGIMTSSRIRSGMTRSAMESASLPLLAASRR